METKKYIKLCLTKRNMNVVNLAEKLDQSPNAIYNKLERGIFKQKDLENIASALNCTLDIRFIDNENGVPLI